ncbi:hypothetical protein IQ07DRAFT_596134 [Pyrenochaeta sp. DS3sAY3a]|nr:hypothetical protein IQ07DRAFT_596134 [Pyrenochaeta sp. DS3sAY3a]
MDGSSTPARWNHRGEMMPGTPHRQPRELTEAEHEEACFWASHVPGGQRYDPVLVKSMRRRHTHIASSSRPLSPESIPVSAREEPSPTPEPEEEGPEPWEAEAAAGIIRKKLSLNLGWGVKTWNMKSSILHRLKLLKDDGYDISHLQVPGTTSDDVTQAVHAHIAARQQPAAAQPTLAAVAVAGPSNPQGGSSTLSQQQPGFMSSTPMKRKMFVVPAVTPQKRRHSFEEATPTYSELHLPWADSSQCESEPSPKRRRTLKTAFSSDREREEVQNFVRRTALREIFQVSRFATNNARHLETAEMTMESEPSQIIFAAYNPSSGPRPAPTGYVGTRGMNAIMAEIKFLGHADVDGTAVSIVDPDTADQEIPRCIQILQDERNNIILEGHNRDLAGLLHRLRTNDLANMTDWEYDGLTVVRKSGLTWTLSEQTQTLLANIEGVLSGGGVHDGTGEAVVVRIEQIYDGRNLL